MDSDNVIKYLFIAFCILAFAGLTRGCYDSGKHAYHQTLNINK